MLSRSAAVFAAGMPALTLRAAEESAVAFPRPLADYVATDTPGLWGTLIARTQAEPFNLVATVIFLLAIVHTFLTARFRRWAHEAEERHATALQNRPKPVTPRDDADGGPREVSFKGQMLHLLGEVEAVFGIWAVVLGVAITYAKGWGTARDYIGHHVNFTEAMFVVVIMAMASARPVLRFAEQCLRAVARVGGESTAAWWLSILIVAPVLGSFVTEPAAMTIGALLLARQFYALKPSPRFCYATLGLLFVNVSVGGTLTHFAAPPVLMVAAPWQWGTAYMFTHFGWRALIGIVLATGLYYVVFRREFVRLDALRARGGVESGRGPAVPAWITGVQLAFMAFTVFVAHYPPLFVGAFLFFLAFARATAHHQRRLDLRPSLLVGFFLAGLVIHGGLQGWWIEPVLKRLGETPLFIGATMLTAFNDNAAITYLATLVPGFTDAFKHAVVAGAVTGGGLTVIANAPNPAGQSILQRFFPDGVSPMWLAVAAAVPTVLMAVCFRV